MKREAILEALFGDKKNYFISVERFFVFGVKKQKMIFRRQFGFV
jgi:hypothetical protein